MKSKPTKIGYRKENSIEGRPKVVVETKDNRKVIVESTNPRIGKDYFFV